MVVDFNPFDLRQSSDLYNRAITGELEGDSDFLHMPSQQIESNQAKNHVFSDELSADEL
jgi:hypothetical protein